MFDVRSMHHIQRKIITELAHKSPSRFSELQPSNVPNNTFSYHLKKLLETGYIELTDAGYVTTRKALKTMSYMGSNVQRTINPVMITMIYVTNDRGDVLVQRRTSRPFFNWYGIPSGLIHGEETVTQAAQRELYEKTGILAAANTLKQHGVLDFRYLQAATGDTFVHAVAFVYSYCCKTDDISTLRDDKFLTSEWALLDSNIRILPEISEVADMVRQPTTTIRSVNFEEPLM